MTTETLCDHEDCDCVFCERCGELCPDGEGVSVSVSIPVGPDDYDHETWMICPECHRKDKEGYHDVPSTEGGDDIPF